MTPQIHKLKLWRGLKFAYWLLCRRESNDILDHRYSWLWSRVTCKKCREIGGNG